MKAPPDIEILVPETEYTTTTYTEYTVYYQIHQIPPDTEHTIRHRIYYQIPNIPNTLSGMMQPPPYLIHPSGGTTILYQGKRGKNGAMSERTNKQRTGVKGGVGRERAWGVGAHELSE